MVVWHRWSGPASIPTFALVAALADRSVAYEIILGGRSFVAGGTSAVAPLWAGLLAVISQRAGRKVGWVNDKIHAAEGRGLRNITSGDNRLPGAKTWFTAGEGWDACTGWGSPDGANIEVALAG